MVAAVEIKNMHISADEASFCAYWVQIRTFFFTDSLLLIFLIKKDSACECTSGALQVVRQEIV